MQSLRGILARHPITLLIDSASTSIHVGLLRADADPLWARSDEEAGVGVFIGTERVLSHVGVSLDAINAFIFCEGPGSVLGIRTAAVSIRTWHVLSPRPLFTYRSLDLVTTFQLLRREGPFTVIADARRDSWHAVTADGRGPISGLRRVKANELTAPLLMPDTFRYWSPLPVGVERVQYDLPVMLQALPDEPLFRETTAPDAFLHEEPSYVTWTPQVHRAPAP